MARKYRFKGVRSILTGSFIAANITDNLTLQSFEVRYEATNRLVFRADAQCLYDEIIDIALSGALGERRKVEAEGALVARENYLRGM
jgi:hypothetical protein